MAKHAFRVRGGKKFRLADHAPAYTGRLDKPGRRGWRRRSSDHT